MVDAVLLIGFGAPSELRDVRPFLAQLLRGRPVPPERIEEVVHHYELIGGGSPFNALTFKQADALRRKIPQPVYVGMRNWSPYLKDVLQEMTAAGVRRAIGIVLAAHRTEASWDRYLVAVEEARKAIGRDAPEIVYVDCWHDHPSFIEAWAASIQRAREGIPTSRGASTHLVMTAHSVPVPMSDASGYARQIEESAARIAERLGERNWSVAYQSRSGSPRDPWLEPDVLDVIRSLASSATAVVVAPIGFLCDHVEVLYDLDVEARAVAEEAGVAFARAATLNDDPAFIELLAELVTTSAGKAS